MASMTVQEAMNRAWVLAQNAHFPEALDITRQILQSFPNHVGAHCLVANIAATLGQNDLAVTHARRAVELEPNYADAYCLLGRAYANLNLLEEAIAAHEKAVALNPANAIFHNLLGGVYWRACLMPQACKAYQRALEIDPTNHEVHSDLIHALDHLLVDEPERAYEAHRDWARAHADPLAGAIRPHTNIPDPDRPLRVGYLSGQFREGTTAYFVEPLLAAHDRSQFQIVCYCTAPAPPNDPVAARMHTYCHLWRDVLRHNDEQLAEIIRNDGIDILFDLAGHTWGNRLLVFARKPAPIQISHIGYQETTGLTTIDYRLSDPYADPPGMTDQHYAERIFRLPTTGYCYRAPDNSPEVSPLPAKTNGYITFGSTNRVSKMTPETIETWCRVLHQVPGSRMLIRSDGLSLPMLQREVYARFAKCGIGPERLEFRGWGTMRDYLETFHHVDIILDCYPFAGHTVSCHALWMGVPVVTRVGQTHTARVGLSVLSNLGLPELAASDRDTMVSIAVDLANDLPRIEQLRSTLRSKMQASPLMDQQAYSRDIAAAYRQMWREWCKSAQKPGNRGVADQESHSS
jgi:predicted O-linked N-acetylglucosamine transferase (SPINDLY family)